MTPLQELQETLTQHLKALDKMALTPPVEITVGEYAFYPYRGFSDLAQREDFKKLSLAQLKMLIKITEDILAMQEPELFEAFVNDDGIIVVDKGQPHIEYSIDIEYNKARSRIEEIYPQVTYPQKLRSKKILDRFVRNDTAHEVAHHADFWIDHADRRKHLHYLHSSSTLLAWLEELDRMLHPDGVAALILEVREAEGYSAGRLLEEGYSPDKVDKMLRAEFFAIAAEFYYGSKQHFEQRSPLLEAYMEYVLNLDLEIQRLYIAFDDMEARRKILRDATHAKIEAILGKETYKEYMALRETLAEQEGKAREKTASAIEALIMGAIRGMSEAIRKKVKVPKR